MRTRTVGPTTELRRLHGPSSWSRLEFPPFVLDLFFVKETVSALDLHLGWRPPDPVGLSRKPCPRPVAREFSRYFQGQPVRFSFATRFQGPYTEFQREVWEALKAVPWGQVRSYGWLAERVGRPRAARAVGGSVGRNPLPIIIPCHRIVESTGALGGYSSGVEIKRRLLWLEGVSVAEGRLLTV